MGSPYQAPHTARLETWGKGGSSTPVQARLCIMSSRLKCDQLCVLTFFTFVISLPLLKKYNICYVSTGMWSGTLYLISGINSDLVEENVSVETIRMLEQIHKLRQNKLSWAELPVAVINHPRCTPNRFHHVTSQENAACTVDPLVLSVYLQCYA